MAILCEQLNLLYIQVPGTGCSVVGKLLLDNYEGKRIGRKHNDATEILEQGLLTEQDLENYLVVANVRNPYDRMVTYYQRLQGDWTENYLNWARKDLKRKLERGLIDQSKYDREIAQRPKIEKRQRRRTAIIKKVGFNPWAQLTLMRWWTANRAEKNNRTSVSFLPQFFPMLDHVHIAMRQERLEEALNEVFRLLGREETISLPRKNLTPGKKHYTAYYNGISRSLMKTLFKKDLDFFGYRFEGLKTEEATVTLAEQKSTTQSYE